MAYTAHDTLEIVARIDRDLATILETLREADPSLRSLVLTGGFARGEGAVLAGAPQNDYDLVAIRGFGPALVPYERLRTDLEARVGLHVDMAPVAAWRLGRVARTIFWYETALRGRTLWGEHLLHRVPVRDADRIDRCEGLRLLVNRAAGLLLATGTENGHHYLVQSSKALLAASDAHLLAAGSFAPSQRERWDLVAALRAQDRAPETRVRAFWSDWAFRFKVDPAAAAGPDPRAAWKAARRAVLDAVPTALRHAGLTSLDDYERRDGLVDHVVYAMRSPRVTGARHIAWHPTGRVRVATLRLLERSPHGRVEPAVAQECIGRMAPVRGDPLRVLDALRRATLQ